MAQVRAKTDAHRHRRQSSILKPLNGQATHPRRIERQQSSGPVRKSTRLQDREDLRWQLENQEEARQLQALTRNSPIEKPSRNSSALISSSSPNRKRKRGDLDSSCQTKIREVELPSSQDKAGRTRKRQRPTPTPIYHTAEEDESSQGLDIDAKDSSILHWVRQGSWPHEYFEQDSNMNRQLLGRKRSSASLGSTPTESGSLRVGKNPAARHVLYEKTLAVNCIFMTNKRGVVPTEGCKILCQTLLDTEQTVPKDSLFRDDIFEQTFQRIQRRNEIMVMMDITPLIVARAEVLYAYGDTHLECLTEEFNAAWSKCIPLIKGSNTQPDYFVGFNDSAFSRDQLRKLEPFVGDFQRTHFMVTEWVHFPFLTCEVKCGQEGLNIADRQNAHSASVAVSAVVELYRAVGREDELNRNILSFSVSHDHGAVKIYGHYAVIDGKDTSFYRHLIRYISIIDQDGKDKWTAYKFTKNIYDIFVPRHLKRIQAAIDQLPNPDGSLNQPSPQQSNTGFEQQDSSLSAPSYSQDSLQRLPSTETTEPVSKKAKGKRTLK